MTLGTTHGFECQFSRDMIGSVEYMANMYYKQ